MEQDMGTFLPYQTSKRATSEQVNQEDYSVEFKSKVEGQALVFHVLLVMG